MRRRWIVTLLVAVLVSPGQAQLPDLPTLGRNWTDVSYPKLFYTIREGFSFGLYYAQLRPMAFADFFEPQPYQALLGLDAQISTSGSKFLVVQFRMPRLVEGWRLSATAEVARRAREWYTGVGNATDLDKSLITDAQPHFYRSDNKSALFRAEVQRTIAGNLRALAGIHVQRWRIDTLAGTPTLLAQQAAAGQASFVGRSTNDNALRVGLVFDSRNDEVAARSGVLVQATYAIADSAYADLTYQRASLSAAGYVPAGERLSFNARGIIQVLSGNPGYGSLDLIENGDSPFVGLGGARTHRALLDRRFLGEDLMLLNVDVRYIVTEAPTLFKVSLVGFYDTGRVFVGENLRLTTDGLHHGGGGGLMVHLFRAALLGGTIGFGPDGTVLQFHSEWTF